MLRVGTDCSGIEAPIQALQQLKIPFRHIFSSEIDEYCIQSIKANYKPKIIFGDKNGKFPEGDIRKRNIKDVTDIDLYVCGFPCQPFSTAGIRQGLEDERGNSSTSISSSSFSCSLIFFWIYLIEIINS